VIIPDAILTFVAASALLAFIPGPDLVFVLTESMLRGKRAGLAATTGLCSGLLFHTAAVTFGVAALVQASPIAFAALRYIGATYLLYLAWKSFSASAVAVGDGSGKAISLPAIYRRGVIMNGANPKVAIFFLAFLPQFTQSERGGVASQMMVLGATFIVCSLACFAIVTLAAQPIGRWIRGAPDRQVWLNRLAAIIFAGLAAKLAIG